MRYMLTVCLLIGCAPPVTHRKTDQPESVKVLEALNVAACTASDATPEARSLFQVITSGDASTADRAFTGIMAGTSAIGKALACYMKNLSTQRMQAGGEMGASSRSDMDILQARAEPCDLASQGYSAEKCMTDLRALSAWMLVKQIKAGRVKMDDGP